MKIAMKISTGWLITALAWAYFVTALFLYIYLKIAWVNTLDVLLGFAVLVAFSAWFVIDRFRYRDPSSPRTSKWVLGPYGDIRRRKPPLDDPREQHQRRKQRG
jgi:hypothetical protein